jgi:soluble lytic murein transglycosylase-like protein
MAVPYLACMVAAAALYHLPPRVLPAIQAVEGGRPGLIHPNRNGTADLGLMQVNTIWVTPLAKSNRMEPGAVVVRLLDDPCFNIAAAGAILRAYRQEAGGNLGIAVGYYHSHTQQLSEPYLARVIRSARGLFGPG